MKGQRRLFENLNGSGEAGRKRMPHGGQSNNKGSEVASSWLREERKTQLGWREWGDQGGEWGPSVQRWHRWV